jgi:hypothetical protein
MLLASRLRCWAAVGLVCVSLPLLPRPLVAGSDTDLDAFMAQVLARRDENWRKLQQYVLDEHETAELLGPDHARLFGMSRDYTWYIRDGVFVRSPLRYDGVALSDTERDRYEHEWIAREQARAERTASNDTTAAPALDADTLTRLGREPQFVSAAYFLRFHFEPGHYAFAGRETFDGRTVYRVEYYPSRLFSDDDEGKAEKKANDRDAEEQRFEWQMNKVALITLWVEPEAHQIVQYTFDNIGFDFMPGRWLVRVDTIRASMRMGEAFPGVWLPRRIEGHGTVSLATGAYTARYQTQYSDYREAQVKARIR